LRDLLANSAIKLTWAAKLDILRSAAHGVAYLHSIRPFPIVHRDLKPSNLLVEQVAAAGQSNATTGCGGGGTNRHREIGTRWNVKVADFGLARVKQDNATMTSCGTPCWTAPEVIRGRRYDEKADVYSFGIVMWQVVTRRRPYDGRNFMGVLTDVLAGVRPSPLPAAITTGSGVGSCPGQVVELMQHCWAANAHDRPSMAEVVECLDLLASNTPAAAAAANNNDACV
jgi:serine/threonine protein kinase